MSSHSNRILVSEVKPVENATNNNSFDLLKSYSAYCELRSKVVAQFDELHNLQEQMLKITQGHSIIWFPDFKEISNQLTQISSTRTQVNHNQTRREEYNKAFLKELSSPISNQILRQMSEPQVNKNDNTSLIVDIASSTEQTASGESIEQQLNPNISKNDNCILSVNQCTMIQNSNNDIEDDACNSDIQGIIIDNPVLCKTNNIEHPAFVNNTEENIGPDTDSEGDYVGKKSCQSSFNNGEDFENAKNNSSLDELANLDYIVSQCENNSSKLELQNIPIDRGKYNITDYSYWSNWSEGWNSSWDEYNSSMDAYLEQEKKNRLSNNYVKPDDCQEVEVLDEKESSINSSIYSANFTNYRNAYELNTNEAARRCSSKNSESSNSNDEDIQCEHGDNEQSKSSSSSSSSSFSNYENEHDEINNEQNSNYHSEFSSNDDDTIEENSVNQYSSDSSQSLRSEYDDTNN